MSLPTDIRPFADDDGNALPILTDEQLLAYLEGNLPQEEAHAIERLLAENSFESDALEGLQALGAEETTKRSARLKHRLRKSLKGRKKYRRALQDHRWIWLTVIIVLLLGTVAFLVLHFLKKGHHS